VGGGVGLVRVGAGGCRWVWVSAGGCRSVRVSAGGVCTTTRGMGRCRGWCAVAWAVGLEEASAVGYEEATWMAFGCYIGDVSWSQTGTKHHW
jgi:hypothetical protein